MYNFPQRFLIYILLTVTIRKSRFPLKYFSFSIFIFLGKNQYFSKSTNLPQSFFPLRKFCIINENQFIVCEKLAKPLRRIVY